MTPRIGMKLLTLCVLAAFVLAACGQGEEPTTAPVDSGGAPAAATQPAASSGGGSVSAPVAMDLAIPADVRFDPALATDADAAVLEVSRYVYDRLVQDQNGQIVEGLARAWSVSDDGLTYEFNLRANAAFADGTPVSTDVVMANFNRWFDPENALHGPDSSVYQAWVQYFVGFRNEFTEDEVPVSLFDGIEKVDDLNFLLHLNVPIDNFLNILALPQFSILNPAALTAQGDSYGTQDGVVDGSGAYLVDSWDEDGLLLVPNGLYWGPAASDSLLFPAP
ncbi:MAG: hypothetical protein EPO32_03270 [Anaerolineae bacterium]|nr:MAG: hypothetical protein EPO32_03270 [Anaerolineae bacterium]